MKQRESVNIDLNTYRRVVYQQKSETPNYFERVNSGEILPDQPYSMYEVVSEAALVKKWSVWRTYDPDSIIIPEQRRCIGDGAFQIGARVANEALIADLIVGRDNKLLSKIKGQTLPLLMLYKERLQTGQMVTKMLDDMVFFARNYRRPLRLLEHYGITFSPKHRNTRVWKRYKRALRVYNAQQTTKTVGDYYLEWRFGWAPLYGDLMASLNASAEAEKKGVRTSARAGMPYEFINSYISPSPDYADIDGHCISKGYYGIKASYHITDVTLAAAVQIMDVPETVWDMIPWSFIIDRVVNVSKFLNLRNATAGVEFISGCRSDYRVHTITGISNTKQGETIGGSPIIYKSIWQGPPRVEVSFIRTVMTGFPSPTLEYPWRDFFDEKYIADYVTLINQRFNRPIRPRRRS